MAPSRKSEALIPLQELDLQIHRLKVQRSEKPQLLGPRREKVARARSSLETLQAEIKAVRLESAKREKTVREFDEKINKLEEQARQLKRNEDYHAMMKEISGLKADRGRVEDGLLDLYMQLDEKSKLEKLRQEEVRAAEADLSEEQRKVDAEIAVIDAQIAELSSRRSALTAAVDPEMLRLYERVLRAKDDGVALAAAGKYEVIEEEGKAAYWQCEGCSVGLTSQDVNLLMAGRELQVCRNCSRILYLRPS